MNLFQPIIDRLTELSHRPDEIVRLGQLVKPYSNHTQCGCTMEAILALNLLNQFRSMKLDDNKEYETELKNAEPGVFSISFNNQYLSHSFVIVKLLNNYKPIYMLFQSYANNYDLRDHLKQQDQFYYNSFAELADKVLQHLYKIIDSEETDLPAKGESWFKLTGVEIEDLNHLAEKYFIVANRSSNAIKTHGFIPFSGKIIGSNKSEQKMIQFTQFKPEKQSAEIERLLNIGKMMESMSYTSSIMKQINFEPYLYKKNL